MRWTYHQERMTDASARRRLNELGADGWELVAVRPGKEGAAPEWVFKRPLPGRLTNLETKTAHAG